MSTKERFGMDKELDDKLKAKYDIQAEAEAMAWIAEVTGKPIETDFWTAVQSCALLCKVVNAIRPGLIAKFTENPKHWLEQKDNVKKYIVAIRTLGVPDHDQVTEADFTDSGKDLNAILNHLFALSRQAQAIGWNGPRLGVRYYKTEEDHKRLAEKKEKERQEELERYEQVQREQAERRAVLEVRQQERARRKSDAAIKRVSQRKSQREERGRSLSGAVDIKTYEKEYEERPPSPIKFGMDLEHSEAKEDSFDHEAASRIMDWIEDMTGQEINDFWVDLKSGRVLCELANKIRPGVVARIERKNIAMMQRENITNFLGACEKLGIRKEDLFDVSDLHLERDLTSVLHTLWSLNRLVANNPSLVAMPTIDSGKAPRNIRPMPVNAPNPERIPAVAATGPTIAIPALTPEKPAVASVAPAPAVSPAITTPAKPAPPPKSSWLSSALRSASMGLGVLTVAAVTYMSCIYQFEGAASAAAEISHIKAFVGM